MEKELTEKDAIRALDSVMGSQAIEILKKWKGIKMPGRDGGYTQELREHHKENGRRYCRIKEMYMQKESYPESEIMKIVKGEF